jgi:hypothetical protein
VNESPDAIQQFTATTGTAVAQARAVAQDVVGQIDAGTYGCEAACRSMVKFFDIVARGSATHFQTVLSHNCCGTSLAGATPCCGMEPSDPILVPADNAFARQLSIVMPFTRVGGKLSIPNNLIGFTPAVLAAGATSFAVYLQDAQYVGASYTGTVRLTRITSDPGSAGYVDLVVPVEL